MKATWISKRQSSALASLHRHFQSRVGSITMDNISVSLLFPSLQRENNSQPFIYEKLFTALEHRYVHKNMPVCVLFKYLLCFGVSSSRSEKTVLRTWIGEELSSNMSPIEYCWQLPTCFFFLQTLCSVIADKKHLWDSFFNFSFFLKNCNYSIIDTIIVSWQGKKKW